MGVTVRQAQAPAFHPGGAVEPWQDPMFSEILGDAIWLEAIDDERLVGTWLLPTEIAKVGKVARRSVRIMPYVSPWLARGSLPRRRDVMVRLITALKDLVVGFELPLAPGFRELGAFTDVGALLETRHTHLVDLRESLGLVETSRTRNTLRAARRTVALQIHSDATDFDFERAIVGSSAHAREVRRGASLLMESTGSLRVADASFKGNSVGQSLMWLGDGSAIIMHSWFDRDCGIRGIPTLLTEELVRHASSTRRVEFVDLEGSVLARVDRFMDGLTENVAPYSIAYWFDDREELLGSVQSSLAIPGRTLSSDLQA